MRVQNSVPSINANNNRKKADNSLSDSIKKLSSGSKINSFADDAAGGAISEKMRAQIRGLDQAVRNIDDARNFFMVGEGALHSIGSILDRCKELAVQAASDTNSQQEREAINNEVQQLISEIDEHVESTSFNGINILKGSATKDRIVNFFKEDIIIRNAMLSRYSMEDTNVVSLLKAAKTGSTSTLFTILLDGETTTRQFSIKIDENLSQYDPGLFNYLNNSFYDSNNSFTDASLNRFLKGVSAALTKGFHSAGINEIVVVDKIIDPITSKTKLAFGMTGGYITGMTCTGIQDGSIGHGFLHLMFTTSSTQLDLTISNTTSRESEEWTYEGKSLWVQMGANSNDNNLFTWDSVDLQRLGIAGANTSTRKNASKAITSFDDAKKHVASVRAKLGAYTNRLDHTEKKSRIASENLVAAESRIRDADMAKSMLDKMKSDILNQTSTAVLVQANAIPQSVLQLIQV